MMVEKRIITLTFSCLFSILKVPIFIQSALILYTSMSSIDTLLDISRFHKVLVIQFDLKLNTGLLL